MVDVCPPVLPWHSLEGSRRLSQDQPAWVREVVALGVASSAVLRIALARELDVHVRKRRMAS